MEVIFELGAAAFALLQGLVANEYVVYGLSLAGVVALFILRHIGQRIAEDIYRKIKGWIFGRSAPPSELPAAVAVPVIVARPAQESWTERYRATELLGANDHARLYRGQLPSGENIFIKMSAARSQNDWLFHERQILQRLTGTAGPLKKHLPHLMDHFTTTEGLATLVFESIPGLSLLQIRERLPDGIPARHSIWLARRILSILGHAHKEGILHGNIEPAHILVRPEDHNVWLIDWSYAIDNPARTGQTFRAHNPPYSPPEVTGRRPPLPASDLYSVGKCLLFALGGDPATATFPPAIEPALARFLGEAILSGAQSRWQDAWQVYGRLDRLREELYGAHEFIPFVVP